jgi:hypothetical protein
MPLKHAWWIARLLLWGGLLSGIVVVLIPWESTSLLRDLGANLRDSPAAPGRRRWYSTLTSHLFRQLAMAPRVRWLSVTRP